LILLGVTYHYVTDRPPPEPRAIFPVAVAELEQQLAALGRAFELVSRDRLVAAAGRQAALPARSCVVTFDDGLRCQVELALPVLERLGMPAVFFVPAEPLREGRALAVHKAHRIRELLGDDEIVATLGVEPPKPSLGEHPYDDSSSAAVKELLAARPAAELDALLERAGDSAERIARDLYVRSDDVVELERRGALGAHGYSHRRLAGLRFDAARDDLGLCATALEAITGRRPLVLSYPHGRATATTAAAAAAAGFRVGFTTERRVNRDLGRPLLLGRVDVNDLPGGRTPLAGLDRILVDASTI
jgi:peptidoglycan/xylan/chitin deacetylase (PgdA/CDA1 family)